MPTSSTEFHSNVSKYVSNMNVKAQQIAHSPVHAPYKYVDKCPVVMRNSSSPSHKNFLQSCKTTQNRAKGCLQFGTVYGGHEMPHPLCWLKPGDVYYGFGCGEDISFDISIADTYGLTLRLFDPTPRAIRHVNAVSRTLQTRKIPVLYPAFGRDKYDHEGSIQEISGGVDTKDWFEKIAFSNVKSSQILFRPWALAVENGNMTFFEPISGVSHSLLGQTKSKGKQITVVARELSSIMAELGDEQISVLKIDIEGYEIVLIPALVAMFRTWELRKLPRILLFDMDSMRPEHRQECVQLLVAAGYELFSSNNYDYTFVLKTLIEHG